MEKSFTTRTLWLQIRTLRCRGCSQDFAYLAQGEIYGRAGGTKYLSLLRSQKGLTREAKGKIDLQLARIQRSPFAGRARCPHCGRLKLWMRVPGETLALTVVGGLLGWLAGLVLLLIVKQLTGTHESSLYDWVWHATGVAGLLLGLLSAVRYPVPAGQPDPASMTLPQLEAFLREAGTRAPEPLWLERVGRQTPRLARFLQEFNAGDPAEEHQAILPMRTHRPLELATATGEGEAPR